MKKLLRILFLTVAALSAFAAEKPGPWKTLFNGKDLTGWTDNKFGGAGETEVKDGRIVINEGVALSGIKLTATNDLPRNNYEIVVRATKLQGGDFFAGITFPVKDSYATFIPGGWGGSLVGISSIDGMDASENDSGSYMKFDQGKEYEFRLRVLEKKLQGWINGEKMIDVNIEGRRVAMRPGEIEDAVPFGLTTYSTRSAISEVKVRTIPAEVKKIVFIAGRKSHGPGEHDYEEGLKILKETIEKQQDLVVDVELHVKGWVQNENTLEDADTIVVYCDGSDHSVPNHPLLVDNRMVTLERQMKRGCGLVCLHYAVFVPSKDAGPKFLQWVGGFFDYETGSAANKWFSKIETKNYQVFPATDHPITKGMKPFEVQEEFYFKMRFPEEKKGWTPVVTFDPEKKDLQKVVGWAIERPNGGRGFGYTGGHFTKNWQREDVRGLVVNAILWTAKVR